MFGHVDVFFTCYLPSLAYIDSPASHSVTNGYSSKDGVDNVLETEYGRAWTVLMAAPIGVMIFSTNSLRCSSQTNSSIWSRNYMQSYVSWLTSL